MSTNLGKVIYLLIAGVFVAIALLLMRTRQVEASNYLPMMSPKDAAEVYHQWIEATQVLLHENQLEL